MQAAFLLQSVLGIRRHVWSIAKDPNEPFPGLIPCAFLEELCCSFNNAYFFGISGGDPLIQRNTVLLCQSLGSLFDRSWEFQWIGGFTHAFTLLRSSAGRKNFNPIL